VDKGADDGFPFSSPTSASIAFRIEDASLPEEAAVEVEEDEEDDDDDEGFLELATIGEL